MGRTVRTRARPALEPPLLSKRQLEIALAKLKTFDDPNLSLEQYPVSPEVAAELLYMAGFENDDIRDRRVVDLGTGTGRLAIGAALLGAKEVAGVDVDKNSLKLAQTNADASGVRVEWFVDNVENFQGRYDTVVMNPPYGTREAHADIRFLEAAFKPAPTIYSIHKSSTRDYLTKFIVSKGWKVSSVRSMQMQLPHLFTFHRKRWKSIGIDLYRLVRSAERVID